MAGLDGRSGAVSRETASSIDAKTSIFLVDDDRDLMSVVEAMLESHGFSVDCAYSGEEAIERLRAQRPNLIILDIMMPGMDGLEVLKRLKEAGETSSIPVILLSGQNEYKKVLDGYNLGADYYISKPFTDAQLTAGIDLVLGNGKK